MTRSNKASDRAVDERIRRVLATCTTYGELESAAGVTDRLAFWKGKTEADARAALRQMIAARVRAGELGGPGR